MRHLGLSLIRTLAVVAVAVGMTGCSSRSGTIVDWFMSAMNDPNFQGEGGMEGSLEMTAGSVQVTGMITGHFKFSGNDFAMSMAMTAGSYATSSETVSVGDWTYERKDGGAWTRTGRKQSSDLGKGIEAAGGIVDKGVESHNGRDLHRLEPKNMSALPPETLGFDASTSSDVHPAITFWVESDGTPAAMTWSATFTIQSGETSVDCSMAFEMAFESRSGVIVEIPEDAAEPSTAPYSQADSLRSDVQVLRTAYGTVTGTYDSGTKSGSLSGSVRLDDGSTEIHLSAPGAGETWSEIVVGGARYTSRDDKIWIDRGKKTTPTLPEALAAAKTDSDAGTVVVDGKAFHRLVSPANSVDVASAFGFDLTAASGPGSRFWLLANEDGELAGFGGSLEWGRVVDGTPQSHALNIEVVLEQTDGTKVIAPKSAWKWYEDQQAGVAFALPSTFKPEAANSTPPYKQYKDAKAGVLFIYGSGAAGKNNAAALANQFAIASGLTIDTTYETDIDGESGETVLGHTDTGEGYIIVFAVVRPSGGYVFGFGAPMAQKKANDTLSDQILATIELLR